MSVLIISNPNAGGNVRSTLQQVERLCTSENIFYKKIQVSSKEKLAEALEKKISAAQKIIVIGGDGSFHQAINAVYKISIHSFSTVKWIFVSAGTGNDWQKTHSFSTNLKERIFSAEHLLHDVGVVTVSEKKELFLNISSVGFSGYCVELAEHLKWVPFGTYYAALGVGMWKYKNQSTTVFIEDQKLFEGNIYMLAAGICNYAGGGMKLCPNAAFNDGLLDITLVADISKLEIIQNTPKLKEGTFLSHPKASSYQGKNIRVVFSNPAPVEADGEYLGEQTEVLFGVLSQQIKVG